MSYPVMPLGFLGSQGDNDTYRIERSLRFNSADSAYLSRTYGSGTSATTWTISCWVKRSSFGAATCIFSERLSSNANVVTQLDFQSSDTLRLVGTNTSGSVTLDLITTQVFRDPSAWFHLVVAADSTQATASERFKIYINGSQVTSLGTATYPAQNSTFGVFSASEHNIGRRFLAVSGTDALFNGYITEFHAIDGQALTPSSFGETDAITGRWKAKAYNGTYGTNGFYLKFADNSGTTSTTLGKDSSGNGNNWTPNNFSVTAGAGNDSLVDSPTNYGTDTGVGGEVRGNYPVFNSASKNSSVTISDGGLRAAFTNNRFQSVTIPIPTTGKWYAEFTVLNGSSSYSIGLGDITQNADSSYSLLSSSPAISYINNGNKNVNGTVNAGGATYTTNDVIGVAVDSGSSSVSFYKNNSLQFTVSGSSFSTHAGKWVFGGDASAFSEVLVFNGGQRPFAYTAPAGFSSLCTTNLPTPTIKKPSSAMDVVTYTGNGSARSITGLGFSPDLVWIKGRSGATDHAIYDSVRGVQRDLGSNLTTDETTQTQGLTAFNSDGFDIGTLAKINTNTSTYVAWAWDRAAIDGLDIVSYTGNGANRTIAHNLGVAPKMIIVKARTTAGTDQGWPVWHTSISNTQYLMLNTDAAVATGATYWNSTSPTSSVFSLGTNVAVNSSNDTYIAYLFSEVEGFSKFGLFAGNSSTDGPFVFCGFRPKLLIFKANLVTNWGIIDASRNTSNVSNFNLYAGLVDSEYSSLAAVDFLSNGFKVRSGPSDNFNYSGSNTFFAAFAESPFKYARAR